MTTTILHHSTNGYYITLSIETRVYGNVYVVEACPFIGEHLCGYPERQMTYNINDEKKAKATFKRYCKKYT